MNSKAPRPCDMCGRSGPGVKLTREHILAQSLRDTIAESDSHTYTEATGPAVADFAYSENARPTSLMDVTVRSICATCNNGWMSDIEVQAKPILRRLIAGAERVEAQEAEVVRLWAAKTAAVTQMAAARRDDTPPVDPADLASIRQGQVPEAWVVTLTRLDPSWRHHTHRGHAPVPLRREVDGIETIERYHLTTIEIGQMFLTVTGGPPTSDVSAEVCARVVQHLWQVVPAIWPLFPDEALDLITWHLPSEQTLQELTLRFMRLLLQEEE